MPDVATSLNGTVGALIIGTNNAVKYLLASHNLIWSHHHKQFLTGENAILGKYFQDDMLREERKGKVYQVENRLIGSVSPIRCELKAVAGLLSAFLWIMLLNLLDMGVACCVAVILGLSAVADDKQLHILIKSCASPEAFALIAVYLVKCLFNAYATSLQLHMNQWQTIDKNCHIITSVVSTAFFLILVYDLKRVVVYVFLVNEIDVHWQFTTITFENLDVILLNNERFFFYAVVATSNVALEEPFPFIFGESIVV